MMKNPRDHSTIEIRPFEPEDVDEATTVMARAFDDDSRRHLGKDRGGPPGYDTGEFLRENALNPQARAFKAIVDGSIAGAIIVFPQPDGNHWLGCMFTDPARQRTGVGRALFRHVERAFPARSWQLETPSFALSNHRFYELACGFKKAGESVGPEGFPQVLYRKEYRR